MEAALVNRPDVVARANHHIAWFLGVLGRASEALEPIIGSRAIWLQLGNAVEISRCKATYAWILMELGDMDSAMPESSEALRVAETAGDDDVLALASNTHALCLILAGQLDAAVPLLDRAVRLRASRKGYSRLIAVVDQSRLPVRVLR